MVDKTLLQEDICEQFCTNPKRTEELRNKIDDVEIIGMAQIFKALSEPSRVKIAYILQEGEELCVCDVAAVLGSSIATASHHLRQLKLLNIAKSRKVGKNVLYSLSDDHIQALITMTLAHQKE